MTKDDIRQMRTCWCHNITKYSGHHVINIRTCYQHFKRTKELGDFRDFSEEVIIAMATDAPLPTETQIGTAPPQTILNNSQTADINRLYELYDGSDNESDEEGYASNVQNWVDEVDNAFEVFGMDRDDYHPEDPFDPNAVEFHQVYGTSSFLPEDWKAFVEELPTYHGCVLSGSHPRRRYLWT